MLVIPRVALAWALLKRPVLAAIAVALLVAAFGDWRVTLQVLFIAGWLWAIVTGLYIWVLHRRDPLWQQYRAVQRFTAALLEAYEHELRSLELPDEAGIARATRRQREIALKLEEAEHGLALLVRARQNQLHPERRLRLVSNEVA